MSDSEFFVRLEALFHELESLPREQQEQKLDALRRGEPALALELEAMLNVPSAVDRHLDALHDVAKALREGPRTHEIHGEGRAAADDPPVMGPYRLSRLLGEGGMGRVYLAEQDEPVRRVVALKITRRGFDSADARARFRAERQALAVLEHPNIARVFDAGSSDDGRPWFAMEYVEGESITRWAERRGLDLRQRIALLLRVCEAVQHAHQKGLIHRDLKPSNILVLDDGDIGQPKVIDFGVAKLIDLPLDERSFATSFGELIGTPEYMSPEQAAMGSIDIDTRADVYALGLVLHELLVGQLPLSSVELRSLAFHEMCRRIREDETPKPSAARTPAKTSGSWRRELRGDLDAVLMKALAKDREQRYDSVTALADDLHRYLTDQPVLAQPPSLRYRAGKFVRRHRVPVVAAGLITAALLVGAAMAGYGLMKARKALAEAEWNLQEAELRNSIANAYADSLRLMFGDDADVDRLTALLLAHAAQRQTIWKEDPEAAALATFAVGRHFLSRNDYTSARAVFEPWLAEDYGPQELRSYGWQLVGFAYRYTGDSDKALSAFRRAGELADPNTRDTVGWASRLAQIAMLSREPADRDAAIQAAQRLLENEDGPTLQVSLLNSLYQLHVSGDELEAAYDDMRRAVEIIDSHPTMDLAGRDTNRLNLARLELYNHRDIPAALRLIETVRSSDLQAKGESRETAHALELEATALRMRGELLPALDALAAALPIYDRYLGDNSVPRRRCEMLTAMTLVDLERLQEARELLDEMASRPSGPDDLRSAMAETYLTLKVDGPAAAQRVLVERKVDLVAARHSDYLRYILESLVAAGIDLPV